MVYTIAGGCSWCLDAVFRNLKGVQTSICGYAGGTADDANYYTVASGRTGHAETVQVTFDESIIPGDTILDIFFLIHDPTSFNRQGADEGPQYRSAMFYSDETQKAVFEAAIARSQAHWDKLIVTTLEPLEAFYEAEPEHQNYAVNNPQSPYCTIVIEPKIIKARHAYASWFKEG